jgi:hypothetical protein
MPNMAQGERLSETLGVMSKTYAAAIPNREGIWRAMTYEILDVLSAEPEVQAENRRIVREILDILEPIIEPSKSADFENQLNKIFEAAAGIWSNIQRDPLRISICESPPKEPTKMWRPAESPRIEYSQVSGEVPVKEFRSLCLFPSVTMEETAGPSIIHFGYSLFPDSAAFAQGFCEQQEIKNEREAMKYSIFR